MSESLPTLITASKSLSDFRAESSEIELPGSFKNAYQMQCTGCNSFMPKFFEHCIVCGHTILETSHLPFIDHQAVYDTYRESMEMRSFVRQKNVSKLKRKAKKEMKNGSTIAQPSKRHEKRLEKLSLPKETIAAIQVVDKLDAERRLKKMKVLKSIMLKANTLELKNAKMIEQILQRTITLKERRRRVKQLNLKGYLDEIESIQSLYSQTKLKITQSYPNITLGHDTDKPYRQTLHPDRVTSPSYLNDPREEGEGEKETKAWLWTNLLLRPVSREEDRPHHLGKHSKHAQKHSKLGVDKGAPPMFWGQAFNNNKDTEDDSEDNDAILDNNNYNNNNNNNEGFDSLNEVHNMESTVLPSIIEDDHLEHEDDHYNDHDLDRHYNLIHTTTPLTFHSDDTQFTSHASATRTDNLHIDLQVLHHMSNELATLEHEIIERNRVPMTIDGFKTDTLQGESDPPTRLLFPTVDGAAETENEEFDSQNSELSTQIKMIKQLRQKAQILLQTLTSSEEEDDDLKNEQMLRLQAQVEHYDYFMLQTISWQLHNLELAEIVRERKALDSALDSASNTNILPPIQVGKSNKQGEKKDKIKQKDRKNHDKILQQEQVQNHDFQPSFTDFANSDMSRNRTRDVQQQHELSEFSQLQSRHNYDEEDDIHLQHIAHQLEEIIEAKRLYSIEREMDMHEIEHELDIPAIEGKDLMPKVSTLLLHESTLNTPKTSKNEPLKVDLLSEYDKYPKLSVNDEETENTNELFLQAEETEDRSDTRLQALIEVESYANFHSAYEKLTIQESEVKSQAETENDEVDISLTRNQLPSHKMHVAFDYNLKLSRLYQRSIHRMRAVLTSLLQVDLRHQNTDFYSELQVSIDEAKDCIDCAHEVHSLVKELLQKFHTETSAQRLAIAQEISETMRHVARIERTFQRKLGSNNASSTLNNLTASSMLKNTQIGSKLGANSTDSLAGKAAGSQVDVGSENKMGEAQEVISVYGEKVARLQQQEADLIEAIRQQELSMQETIDLWRPKHSQVLNECTIAMIRAQGYVFAFRT